MAVISSRAAVDPAVQRRQHRIADQLVREGHDNGDLVAADERLQAQKTGRRAGWRECRSCGRSDQAFARRIEDIGRLSRRHRVGRVVLEGPGPPEGDGGGSCDSRPLGPAGPDAAGRRAYSPRANPRWLWVGRRPGPSTPPTRRYDPATSSPGRRRPRRCRGADQILAPGHAMRGSPSCRPSKAKPSAPVWAAPAASWGRMEVRKLSDIKQYGLSGTSFGVILYGSATRRRRVR